MALGTNPDPVDLSPDATGIDDPITKSATFVVIDEIFMRPVHQIGCRGSVDHVCALWDHADVHPTRVQACIAQARVQIN